MNQPYELSGKPGNLWVTGLLSGPPLAIILSIIYAYITVYNPIIYLTLLVYLGYLFGIIFIQKIIIRIAKCRNRRQAFIYGALVGLFALYANWCTFLYVLLQRFGEGVALPDLLGSPVLVMEMASSLAEEGWYSIGSFEVNGVLLYIIWIIEAAGILGASILGASKVLHEEVFCENCNRWAEDVEFGMRLSLGDKEKADAAIQQDITGLLDLQRVDGNETPHLQVNLHHCSECDNFSTVDVDLITLERNKKGEIEENNDDLTPVYLLSKENYLRFMVKKEQFANAEPPPHPEQNAMTAGDSEGETETA